MMKKSIQVFFLACFLPVHVQVFSLSTTPRPNTISPNICNSAIEILEEQSFRNVPLDAALRRYAKRSYLDSQDQNSLRELLLGVARRQYRIDWRLREAGLECSPEHRVITALGGGYIGEMGGTNIVNELTALYPWLEGVLNIAGSTAHTLEVDGMNLQTRLECPDWAWRGLKDAFSDENDLMIQAMALQKAAPLDLRVNTLKCERRDDALRDIINAGFDATATPWSPIGIRFKHRVPLGKIPGLLSGIVEPMDEGSQLVAALVDAKPGEKVADYCAGTGGKTLQIAAQMQNRGILYSLDIDADRLERGRSRCSKAGVSNVQRQAVQTDMTRKDKWCKRRKRTFDRVLVDAPCSGVGSWRRKPDARRTWGGLNNGNGNGEEAEVDKGVERLANLLPLQQHILRRAARLVKPGGRLVYVTCSLLPEENERQIEEFLGGDEGGDWHLDPPRDFYVPFDAGDGHYLRLTPAQHNTDGFFAAVLTRNQN